ncbi:MAG: ABC transporter ATP-binding protein [SAR324 cluster bacterium]|nr:ABC transporter ATP-binding protein [SAR324 cluster bacterium]
MSSIVIKVEHLHKTYGPLKAVNDLSFEVNRSVCHGFLGPNGAGKTTTMKILYGRNQRDSFPSSKVNVFGYDPGQDELQIKFFSGVVPQEDNLDSELNVHQNLEVYSKFYGMGKKAAQARIDELLEFMELSEKHKGRIRELSGGMKRRLSIVRAILHDPQLLILDEPTTGLDPQVRHLIWSKLRQLKENGVTILLTTHYMEEAFQICDVITIMDKGRKMMEGEPQSLLSEHVEQFVLETRNINPVSPLQMKFNRDLIRLDDSHKLPMYYSNDFTALKNLSDQLEQKEYNLRQSNLEDLFLKVTGRTLNEEQ